MGNHHDSFHLRQQRNHIHRCARESSAVEFFNVLTGPELLEVTEAHLPRHRERLYPPTVTLAMFLRQALEADRSCQRAVNGWAVQRVAEGLRVQSVRTGAYCRARARLPLPMVQALTRESGRLLSERARSGWRWRGRTVKLADGTGLSMPDTEENQAVFPQSHTQAPGVGFPLGSGSAFVICLSTGAVLDGSMGPYSGKGTGELGLFRSLAGALSPGDVLLADALYCSYFIIATLSHLLIHLLMASAAAISGVHPRELSFKHTVQLWIEWTSVRLICPSPDTARLFALIAQRRVGNRPGRIEPRARKRRPKPYPWLKVPRAAARRQIRVYGHLLEA